MKQKELIEKVASLLKLKTDDLSAAFKAEPDADVTVVIDEKLSVFTEDEVTIMKGNSYKEGKKAGVEMEVDEIKKEQGLEFTGKSLKSLTEAIAKKTLADAKIEPEKKVVELEAKLKTAQTTAQELQQKLQEKEGEVTTIKTQSIIAKDLPENLALPAHKVLLLMKEDGYSYVNENGKIIWSKDGTPMTDKLGNNLSTKDVAFQYATENKLITEEGSGGAGGGRGGKDKPAGGNGVFTKLSELKEKFTAEGKSLLGTEFSQAVQEAAKVEGFDMNA